MTFFDLEKTVAQTPARSAWLRGVRDFAVDLLQEAEENGYNAENLKEAELLNGARDWREFSYNGLWLCYDVQIAAALCAPYELKKTQNGYKRPNARENWLDVQARALWQAARLIFTCREKLFASGHYNEVMVRKETVFYRDENNEFSTSEPYKIYIK
ncbi:MAG: hypothetical protein IKU25_05200 [Clostridia bacterium]|nr:hypothetical protein [Clostridia bacterium]